MGIRRAPEQSLVKAHNGAVQVVLRFLVLDEPRFCSKKKSTENETVEDLRAACWSKVGVLVNQLSVFVEALIGDGNPTFVFLCVGLPKSA